MLESLQSLLKLHQQTHLLTHWDRLDEAAQKKLAEQIRSIDFEQVHKGWSSHDEGPSWAELAKTAEPPPAFRLHSANRISKEEAIECGVAALRQGKLGAILVAGGQGTRLGFDLPKGMFPIGPVSNRTLFQMHIDQIRSISKRYGRTVPLYVMTSPATHQETLDYFEKNSWFGLSRDDLVLFCQGTMPAVDAKTGKVLLSSPCEIALSPDGHGGLVAAFAKNGCLESCKKGGIEYLFYAQVDNPLVPFCDPELIGYHILSKSEMTTQVVQKRFAKEKVGNVVALDGKVAIIEYSDLPDAVAEQTNTDGSLKLWAGNIAVHLFDTQFLDAMSQKGGRLPFHRALKAVPTIDDHGNPVKPVQPNAIKLERFVFDLLPMAKNAIVVEGDAAEVFAPVKNGDGAATDTPTTSRAAIVALHRKWLESAGLIVAPDVLVEIDPGWAMDEAEVSRKIQKGFRVEADTYFGS